MQYTALLIDIVNSKKFSLQDRDAVQIFLKNSLNVLNRVFRPSLAFDVIFSAGDEVQGLFINPTSAIMYYRLLKMILVPIEIRCGIGVGEWEVKIINGTSSEQDGSAYHNARKAISQVHQATGWGILFNSNDENNIYINSLLNTSFLLSKGQTIYQNDIALVVELANPFFDEKTMAQEALQEIIGLLSHKENMDYYLLARGKTDKTFKTIHSTCLETNPVHVFSKTLYKDKIFLESTIKKGISKKISDITNTTRQNIDRIIKSGNISAIRNLDLTTIIYVFMNYQR